MEELSAINALKTIKWAVLCEEAGGTHLKLASVKKETRGSIVSRLWKWGKEKEKEKARELTGFNR